mmetsp:Transcript_12451/g.20150  ORF Transcript_12451/g.20150 Transcript_12451/m.20150 type:complete len:117 (+) Transcript_12451:468-818(+)
MLRVSSSTIERENVVKCRRRPGKMGIDSHRLAGIRIVCDGAVILKTYNKIDGTDETSGSLGVRNTRGNIVEPALQLWKSFVRYLSNGMVLKAGPLVYTVELLIFPTVEVGTRYGVY